MMRIAMLAAAMATGQPKPELIPTPALRPASKWLLAYNQGDCTMTRAFGDAAAIVTLVIQPSADMTVGNLALLSPALSDKRVRRGTGRVVMTPSGVVFGADRVSAPVGDGRLGTKIAVDGAFWEALKTADSLSFEREGMPTIALATGSIGAASRALNTCGADLLRHWGIDLTALLHIPAREMLTIFTFDQYPLSAIAAREQGLVGAVATIGRKGNVTACRIVKSSGSSALDEATCKALIAHRSSSLADPTAVETRFVYVPVRWTLPSF